MISQADLFATKQALDEALADPEEAQHELASALEEHGATEAYSGVKARLEKSPVQVQDLEIFDWEQLPPGASG
jgi:hypothetical protein